MCFVQTSLRIFYHIIERCLCAVDKRHSRSQLLTKCFVINLLCFLCSFLFGCFSFYFQTLPESKNLKKIYFACRVNWFVCTVYTRCALMLDITMENSWKLTKIIYWIFFLIFFFFMQFCDALLKTLFILFISFL